MQVVNAPVRIEDQVIEQAHIYVRRPVEPGRTCVFTFVDAPPVTCGKLLFFFHNKSKVEFIFRVIRALPQVVRIPAQCERESSCHKDSTSSRLIIHDMCLLRVAEAALGRRISFDLRRPHTEASITSTRTSMITNNNIISMANHNNLFIIRIRIRTLMIMIIPIIIIIMRIIRGRGRRKRKSKRKKKEEDEEQQ